MAENKGYKRNIAYKLRIGDILIGKPVMDGERFSFLEIGDKRVVRVNLIGNIVDKFDSNGEKKYVFFTLDDGSGQMRLKAFGDDSDKFREVQQGQTVLVIGRLRSWNNENYVQPEIIKEKDPKYLMVRKLEIENQRNQEKDSSLSKDNQQELGGSLENNAETEGGATGSVKDKILDKIKNAENDGGIEKDQIIMSLREVSPEIINQEIKKMLEEGIVFEPRPGKVRYLG
ncbi:MAG TPA: OB-fold nucleic acid binding domain-containing protein [Candidatus Nanoarchaeia archaeon]|nr:OB-fold nucleic acid binding domain-containing protein [Candidatus Nanoarchaeia archaeon]